MIVNVLDIQDAPPYFTGMPYIASTVENLPTGSRILQVTANDGDGSNPRAIRYFFKIGTLVLRSNPCAQNKSAELIHQETAHRVKIADIPML